MVVAAEKGQVTFEGCRLLLGVARLGDRDLRGWWRSSAMDVDVGRFVLHNTFPRTGRLAAAELLVLSATRRHRQVLDRPNALHLFSERLHFARWTQAWLAEQKTAGASTVIDELESWSDVETATSSLRRWIGDLDPPTAEPVVGAVNLGRLPESELEAPTQLLEVAKQLAYQFLTMTEFEPPYLNIGTSRC